MFALTRRITICSGGVLVTIYHIRIINPSGETIAIDNLGSGVFTNAATEMELRYTVASALLEYDYEANRLRS